MFDEFLVGFSLLARFLREDRAESDNLWDGWMKCIGREVFLDGNALPSTLLVLAFSLTRT